MGVKLSTILENYPDFIGRQIGFKQLFVLTKKDNTLKLLVSYHTIVGFTIGNVWWLTSNKYSRTTSKQLSQFARSKDVRYLPQSEDNLTLSSIQQLLKETYLGE
jgi:hypothetical protein